jgi:hypothetical protein
MAAGDFSPSQINKILLKAESMWTNSQLANSQVPHAEAAQALIANQTARITALEDKEKDNVVKINWVNTCAVTVQDCTTNCELTGPQAETGSKEYTLDLCKEVTFSVDAEKLRTNTYSYDEVVAPLLNTALNKLDEYVAQQTLVKLKAYSGVNAAPEPWTYNTTTGTTDVPNVDWNLSMVAHLLNQADLNNMDNPYFIESGSLWIPWTNAMFNAGNFDGKGDLARMQALNGRFYFDRRNFAKAGITEDMFMVNPGAVALANKTRNPENPTEFGGKVAQTRWTIASRSLPGVSYDVFYQLSCITVSGKEHLIHTFKIQVLMGIFLNPEGCPITINSVVYSPTGVISYNKLAAA